VTVGGTLDVTGGATVGGTLGVTGAATFGAVSLGPVTLTSTVTGLTRPGLPSVGPQISASCGAYSRILSAWGDVDNLSVTITTTGRPVMVFIQPDGSANAASLSTSSTSMELQIVRDSTSIFHLGTAAGTASHTAALGGLDVVGAGTHTYKVQASAGGATAYVNYLVLVAFEL
jgi:hypothetical protein